MARERLSAPAFPAFEWFEALRDAAAVDPELAVVGEKIVLLRVRDGDIAEIVSDPDIGASWDVTLRGTETDWQTFRESTC
jgi:hypothetical protein